MPATPSTAPEASDVGLHCSICNTLDFLPFRCPHCDAIFCKQHASRVAVDAHNCPNSASVDAHAQIAAASSASGTFAALLPDRSRTQAGQSDAVSAKAAAKQAALDVLHKNFPKTAAPTTTSSAGPTLSKPIPKSVLAMKLKAKAKPADPSNKKIVAASDKRYVAVTVAGTAQRADLWLNQVCGNRSGGVSKV